MPGMRGPELQRKLIASQHSVPIIFITAHADESVRARVMGDAAVDCLLKRWTGSEQNPKASGPKAMR
jgi:FixJ family two-component response regulator